jgi:predicted dehydrogenase
MTGVVDLRQERLELIQSRYPAVRVEEDYRELFKMGLDAVVVATPPKTHYALAKDCLDQGLHVLVEKPLTLNSREAEELVAKANDRNLTLMVGHTFTYNPAVYALKDLVTSGELGEIYYVDTARLNLGNFQDGLNALWDLAPHDVSILMHVLGQIPVTVQASGASCIFEGLHDVVYMDLKFPAGFTAHIHVSWLDPCKVRRVTIVGSKKMAVFNDMESLEKIKIYDRGVETPGYTDNNGFFQCSYRYGDIRIPNIHFSEPLRLECQDFLNCIIDHTRPCSCGEDGWNVVKILEAAQRSLENGWRPEAIS